VRNRVYKTIAGLDEAGRGSLAGPLVGAITILSFSDLKTINKYKNDIKDSKKMTPGCRIKIFRLINKLCIPYQIVFISHKFINKYGIGIANKIVFKKLINLVKADLYIIDGILNPYDKKTRKNIIIKPHADATEIPVQLAGIIAKVIRDDYMIKQAFKYPAYGFEFHKGYGTKKHINAIIKYGKTIMHRNLFVQTAVNNYMLNHNY